MATPAPPPESQEPRLESWKEIAAYLNRDARTVRRWEQAEGLPVHRHRHLARSSVYAFPSELDAWRQSRKTGTPAAEPVPTTRRFRSVAAAAAFCLATMTAGSGRIDGAAPAVMQGAPQTSLIWTGSLKDVIYGKVSRDGRYVPFTRFDKNAGDIFLYDLASRRDVRVTRGADNDFGEGVVLSRDMRRVAYAWYSTRTHRYELRTTDVAADGAGEFRTLVANEDIAWIAPYDWSDDGRIAVAIQRVDRTAQIGIVSSWDGTLRVIQSVDWRGPANMAFGPGGSLAFDLPVAGSPNRDVFVMSSDFSRKVAVAPDRADDQLIDWSRDGQGLVLASDRGGSNDAWLQRLENLNPAGPLQALGAPLGLLRPIGLTTAGGLYLAADPDRRDTDIKVGNFDFSTGRWRTAPSDLVQERFTGSNQSPAWSPDGRSLAYIAQRGSVNRPDWSIAIRPIGTASAIELRPPLETLDELAWLPDGSGFIVHGTDATGRSGLWRVDKSAQATVAVARRNVDGRGARPWLEGWTSGGRMLISGPRRTALVEVDLASGEEIELFRGAAATASDPLLSRDGRRLYYRRILGQDDAVPMAALVERTLGSNSERELYRARFGHVELSPDGRLIAINVAKASENARTVVILPVAGGAPREIPLGDVTTTRIPLMLWAPDSQSLLIQQRPKGKNLNDVLWVPVDVNRSPRMVPFGDDANGHWENPYNSRLPWAVTADGHVAVTLKSDAEPQPTRVVLMALPAPRK